MILSFHISHLSPSVFLWPLFTQRGRGQEDLEVTLYVLMYITGLYIPLSYCYMELVH